MEGQVFLCTWQYSDAGYRVWVLDRPALAAEDAVFEAADEALADVICGATGDGENAREYDPPPPQEERSGLLLRLLMASGDRRGLIENVNEVFTEEYCPQCKRERGERTEAPLRLASLEPGGNAGYAKIKPVGFGGPRIKFFSEEFVGRLMPEERSQFEWRPILSPPRIKKRFLELVRARVHTPFVSLSGLAATLWDLPGVLASQNSTLSRCDTCGRVGVPVYGYRMSSMPSYYVSIADLPEPLPTCIGIGSEESPRLSFTPERWSELVRLPESRGLRSDDVGVVAASLVDPAPAVRSLAELTKESRRDAGL